MMLYREGHFILVLQQYRHKLQGTLNARVPDKKVLKWYEKAKSISIPKDTIKISKVFYMYITNKELDDTSLAALVRSYDDLILVTGKQVPEFFPSFLIAMAALWKGEKLEKSK